MVAEPYRCLNNQPFFLSVWDSTKWLSTFWRWLSLSHVSAFLLCQSTHRTHLLAKLSMISSQIHPLMVGSTVSALIPPLPCHPFFWTPLSHANLHSFISNFFLPSMNRPPLHFDVNDQIMLLVTQSGMRSSPAGIVRLPFHSGGLVPSSQAVWERDMFRDWDSDC